MATANVRPSADALDVVLHGGTVIDGSGKPGFVADVGISRDRIAVVGSIPSAAVATVIDVTGRIVAPGFIDIHTHSDATLLEEREGRSAVAQGITTEVVGNCGSSIAPVSDQNRDAVAGRSRKTQPSVGVNWTGVGEYLDRVREGNGANCVFLIGHGTLRSAVLGPAERPATREEVRQMMALLDAATLEGARGLSFGPPSRVAEADELASLATLVAGRDGIVANHIRDRDLSLEGAVAEAIEVARRSDARLQLSHLMAKPWHTPGAWERTMSAIDIARSEGIDIGMDMIPFDTTGTAPALFLPSWARAGGAQKLLARLRTPDVRARIRAEYQEHFSFLRDLGWGRVILGFSDAHRDWIGERFNVLAERLGDEPIEVLLRVLEDEGEGLDRVIVYARLFDEDHIRQCFIHPLFSPSSDGARGTRDGGPGEVANHPNSWAWTIKVLADYVREQRAVSLEEAIRKMTSQPAERLRLRSRGTVREGSYADVIVFDSASVSTESSLKRPAARPRGIDHVFVNGQRVVSDGKLSAALPGRVL